MADTASPATPTLPVWIGPPPWYTNYRQIVNAVLSVFIPAVLIVVGTLGNILALVVFRTYQRSNKSSATFLLQILCVVDTFYLLLLIPTDWGANCYTYGIFRYDYMRESDVMYEMAYNLCVPLAEYSEFLTYWTVVVVSGDRLIHIARPFFAMQHNMLKYAKYTIAILLITSGLYISRMYIIQDYYYSYHPETGQRIAVLYRTRFNMTLEQERLYEDIESWLTQFIFAYIPTFVFILPMNVLMILILNKSGKAQEEMKERSAKEKAPKGNKSTKMIVVMITVFMALKLPFCVTKIYIFFYAQAGLPTTGEEADDNLTAYDMFYTFTRTLITANSAVNCLIYFSSGKQFRRALIALFRGKQKRESASATTEISQTAQTTG